MWRRLPPWMSIGAWLLAFLAGMANVVGLIGFQKHLALTHMTGLTSTLARSIADFDQPELKVVASIMFSFVSGAALSGMLIRDSALHLGPRYGLAMFIEGVLLVIATLLIGRNHNTGYYLASFACGLQNAMASSFSGSAVRTTHVSGMFTDLGISIGHWFRGTPVDLLRLRFCVSTITGFATGGIVATILFRRIGTNTMFVPAGLALALAAMYRLILVRKREQSA